MEYSEYKEMLIKLKEDYDKADCEFHNQNDEEMSFNDILVINMALTLFWHLAPYRTHEKLIDRLIYLRGWSKNERKGD